MTTGEAVTVALLVLVPAALLWFVFLMRTGGDGRGRIRLGIPRALRPGEPDDVIEGRRLERIQWAGVLSSVSLAVFVVGYWLPETQRQEAFVERFSEESTDRGELIYAVPPQLDEDADPLQFKLEERQIALGQGCAGCHGPEGEGGEAQFGYKDPVTGKVVRYRAPPLNNVFQRWDEEVVRLTIERGRPGTPMPAWSVDFGGSMTPLMVEDVMAYLRTLPGNQRAPEELPSSCDDPTGPSQMDCGKAIFEARCTVCHGPQGQGKDAEGVTEQAFVERYEGSVQSIPPDQMWYQGLALWKGKVRHLDEGQHLTTVVNGRRLAFMPPFGDAPAQGIPIPPYPLTNEQIEAVVAYERSL